MSEIAFHEKAGRSQVGSFVFSLDKDLSLRPSLPLSPCFHPHSLRSDSFRWVHVGRSRFSRCCHLRIALWFCAWRVEPGARRLTQSPELGFGLLSFLFLERF